MWDYILPGTDTNKAADRIHDVWGFTTTAAYIPVLDGVSVNA